MRNWVIVIADEVKAYQLSIVDIRLGWLKISLSRITRISAAADQQRSFAMRGHSVQTSSDSLAFQLWRYGISFGWRRLLVSATQSYLIMSVWIIMPCWCILRNEISSSSHHAPIFQFIFLPRLISHLGSTQTWIWFSAICSFRRLQCLYEKFSQQPVTLKVG